MTVTCKTSSFVTPNVSLGIGPYTVQYSTGHIYADCAAVPICGKNTCKSKWEIHGYCIRHSRVCPAMSHSARPLLHPTFTHVAALSMSAGDFLLQMPPTPRSQLEVITGESDSQPQRRGGITRLTVDVPSARRTVGETRPSRWRTPEFFVYYAIFITAVPWMIYVPIQLSSSAYHFAVFWRACRP